MSWWLAILWVPLFLLGAFLGDVVIRILERLFSKDKPDA